MRAKRACDSPGKQVLQPLIPVQVDSRANRCLAFVDAPVFFLLTNRRLRKASRFDPSVLDGILKVSPLSLPAHHRIAAGGGGQMSRTTWSPWRPSSRNVQTEPLPRYGRQRPKEMAMRFARITVDPNQMDGVPCIRGLRIPVATLVGMIADAMHEDEILQAFPDLERDDIREALRYAAEAVRERELPLVTTA